jgi:hypothetical protein
MLEELRKALHDASISRKDLDSKITSSPTPGQSTSLVLVTERRHILRPQRAIQDLAKELVLWSNANESIRSAKGEEHTTSDRRGDRNQPAPEAARYESAPGELEDGRPRRVELVEPPKKKEQESKPKEYEVDLNSIIDRLLEVRGSRPGKQVQLLEAEIRYLCAKAREIFISQSMLRELAAPLTVGQAQTFRVLCAISADIVRLSVTFTDSTTIFSEVSSTADFHPRQIMCS